MGPSWVEALWLTTYGSAHLVISLYLAVEIVFGKKGLQIRLEICIPCIVYIYIVYIYFFFVYMVCVIYIFCIYGWEAFHGVVI